MTKTRSWKPAQTKPDVLHTLAILLQSATPRTNDDEAAITALLEGRLWDDCCSHCDCAGTFEFHTCTDCLLDTVWYDPAGDMDEAHDVCEFFEDMCNVVVLHQRPTREKTTVKPTTLAAIKLPFKRIHGRSNMRKKGYRAEFGGKYGRSNMWKRIVRPEVGKIVKAGGKAWEAAAAAWAA
ncbi:uncharacterized protein LOC62_07G009461 [Vanrija pseudolonga]|uniref:Uncharacterized protein n=1 Tax=Vanrija pseudolonga TaxID=143232 RepID=A0AAF0YLY1_9TREE|nr:hypothetical protein LOC62_07G009461 [Vanrija pseudolonga]